MNISRLKDECSFVSLRDVERAMLVFIYFFEKMHLFRDPIDRKKMEEVCCLIVVVQPETFHCNSGAGSK